MTPDRLAVVSDPRAALEAIGQLPDGEIDIADAAIQLARVDAPDADWYAARAHLSNLARDGVALAADVPPDDLGARAGALAGLLAGRYGYAGDTETYDDTANANLIRVIERRRGLQVALGILWLHVGQAAEWPIHGIDFPGHFLIALDAGSAKLVLDVFNGGMPRDARELRVLLKAVEGSKAELRPALLAPMSNRDVLLRLQHNVKMRRLNAGDVAGALACTQDMLRMAPDAASQWREAAVMHQRLDQVAAALRCYDRFLTLVPDGEAAQRVRASADELRARLN